MNIYSLLVVAILAFLACAVLGLILLKISISKDPQSTQRTIREMLIGAVAGAVAAFSLSIVEMSGNDGLSFLFGFYVLLCMMLFTFGMLSLIIIYFFPRGE